MRNILGASVLLLTLASCQPIENYNPQLAEQPHDVVKYQADKKFCTSEALQRKEKSRLTDGDLTKTPREMIDECMSTRGYKVVKVWHCC